MKHPSKESLLREFPEAKQERIRELSQIFEAQSPREEAEQFLHDHRLGTSPRSTEKLILRVADYKFEVIGGIVETIPENYTSRTCPSCGNVKKNSPSDREYRCSTCKFRYDRDGIGAINIFKKVSFGCDWQSQSLPDVVGSLTPPIGWKYNSSQDCLVHSG